MTFSSLEYFSAVARARSFTGAAAGLHMTQQSLSAQIAALEKELGCRLFERHIPLELTYAGQVLLRYAEHFQKEKKTMEQEFCDISGNQKGVLRIGVSPARERAVLPEILLAFQERFPNISAELREDYNEDLHGKLLNGDIDLAIGIFPHALPGAALRDFYREEEVMLISKDCFRKTYGPRAEETEAAFREGRFEALKECPVLAGSERNVNWQTGLEVLRRAGVDRPLIRVSSGNLETLLELCIRGAGACFSPELLADSLLSSGDRDAVLRFRLGEAAGNQIRFAYQTSSYAWSVIRAFMDIAADMKKG